MKKFVVSLLIASMTFAVFGCSKDNDVVEIEIETAVSQETEETAAATVETTEAPETIPEETADVSSVGVSSVNGTYTFEFAPGLGLKEDSWLGLVPADKECFTSDEANEVQIFWMGPNTYSGAADEKVKYIYSSEDIASIPEGEYIMVLCDSDNNGKVVLQFPITVRGAELIPDLSQVKVN